MSYADMVNVSQSETLADRIKMCATQELPADVPPEHWVWIHLDRLATQPGWGAAFASARANGIEDPGADESVITDGMILSAVQALIADDDTRAQAKAAEAEAAEVAKAKAEQEAEERMEQRQRDHDEWRMVRQAEIAQQHSPLPAAEPEPDVPEPEPTKRKASK